MPSCRSQALSANARREDFVQIAVDLRRDQQALARATGGRLGEGFETAVSCRPLAGVDLFEAAFRLWGEEMIKRVIRDFSGCVAKSGTMEAYGKRIERIDARVL